MGDSSVSFQQSALKHAAVYPTKIDKQKVGLVLNVFCDYTSAALINSSIACESFTDTARLIQLVVALWKLLNCKHRFQHLRFNDPDRVLLDLTVQALPISVSEHMLKSFKGRQQHHVKTASPKTRPKR